MLQTPIKKLNRLIVRKSVFFLPEERQIAIERRHRGKEQYRKLCRADCIVAAYGNSGRTWLRVMLSRFYQAKYGFTHPRLLVFDNFHRKNPAIPKIFITHDNFIKDYTGNFDTKADYHGRKTILLVRNPPDVSVSQYFQWKHRMKPQKKSLNSFPPHGTDVPLFDFVMRSQSGLPKIINFMNVWANDMPNLDDFLLVRYEDLRSNPGERLREILEFIGTPGTDSEIGDAVEYGSIENMKKMEQHASSWFSGGRLKPRDPSNPESYKVRRAKVGGYRDYFNAEQLVQIDALVNDTLSPVFGYAVRSGQPQSGGETIALAGGTN